MLSPYCRSSGRRAVTLPPLLESFTVPHGLSLVGGHSLAAHAITACTSGTVMTPLPYRSLAFFQGPAPGNPAFSDRQSCDALRSPFRPFPPCICGCSGKLAGVCLDRARRVNAVPFPFPESSRELSCELGAAFRFELGFRQCSLDHAHHYPDRPYARQFHF